MLSYIAMEEKHDESPLPMARVVKQGYLKKLKTMKKKFFVLKSEAPENSARLEYYDSEKKWKSNTQPKRVISLKSCFNITRRLDTRQKHVIALYTKEECMCVVLDGEEELANWLQALLSLLDGDATPDHSPHPRQHVWQVNVQKKGLGASRNILGLYNLCLTDKLLSLVKIRPTNSVIPHDMRATDTVEFSLISIRRCGDSECFFYMEVGRSSVTGAGELWMHTEDPNIAQSMHATILHAMSTGAAIREEFGPKFRKRALSANEASKPISVLARRQTHTGTKPHALSPSSENTLCGGHSCIGSCITPCVSASAAYCPPQDNSAAIPEESKSIEEATDSTVITSGSIYPGRHPFDEGHTLSVVHERTRSLPITGEETSIDPCVANKNCIIDRRVSLNNSLCSLESAKARPGQSNGVHPYSRVSQKGGGRRASTGCRLVKCSPSHARSGSGIGVQCARERCDSLPSRAPVSGTQLPIANTLHQRVGNAMSGMGGMPRPLGRPYSMYSSRGISHSPPNAVNSPLSPHSDSAGSSISIDETDSGMHHMSLSDDSHHMIGRLINSRTPDERVIPEEVSDDPLCPWQPELAGSLDKMSLHYGSPGVRNAFKEQHPRKESICEMSNVSSPVSIAGTGMGTSPQESGGYMPMSPTSMEAARMIHSRAGGTPSGHSRTSSVAEESIPFPDGNSGLSHHTTDDGYVDMLPSGDVVSRHAASPAESASSAASGPPSNDLRFSEFHLEKVTVSYFTPSEEGEANRPMRAHSVGSRPDVKKVINRPDSADAARARAFSVGSRSKNHKDRVLSHGGPLPHSQYPSGAARPGSMSCSAPLLVGTRNLGSAEPLDDLMEMDFTNAGDSPSAAGPTVIPLSTSRDSHLSLSVTASGIDSRKPGSDSEGYMDMSPGGLNFSSAYVEMKPTDLAGSGNSTPVAEWNSSRHCDNPASVTHNCGIKAGAHEGYVEMSSDTLCLTGDRSLVRSRVSSLPIAINTGSPKEGKGFTESTSNVDSAYGAAPYHGGDRDPYERDIRRGAASKISPGISPVAPIAPGPFAGFRRNSKKHQRRNSKESPTPTNNHSQTIFHFSLNSPGSPVKPFDPVIPGGTPPGRKCPVDASSGTVRLSRGDNLGSIERIESRPVEWPALRPNADDVISDYMDMIPSRLSTVEETGETFSRIGVDKDMKHLLNSATRESGSSSAADLSDYINLNPNATVKNSRRGLPQQNYSDEAANKTKSPNGGRAFAASKVQSFVKISAPVTFSDGSADADAKENRGILSSNPLAGRTLTCNLLTKAGMNAANAGRIRAPRKPVLVISQTQPTAADFRPIAPGDVHEPRSTKSGSPKLVESALNRALLDGRGRGGDGYETISQNGQPPSSRPASVNNNKCKKSSRPPSANSETSGGATRSRPSSVSSEVSGTPTDSRPASVTGEREVLVATIPQGRGLHYASLELDAPAERSPRPPAAPAFTYAQIDFVKSEELKNSKNFAAKSKN